MATVAEPSIIKFGFTDYKVKGNVATAKCKFCKQSNMLSDKLGVTSNFVRHLSRIHKDRHTEYNNWKTQQELGENQMSVRAFLTTDPTTMQQYTPKHLQQQNISESIVRDLIIGCNMPLSIVENRHFRAFLKVIDARYQPQTRHTVSNAIYRHVESSKRKLMGRLKEVSTVNVTVDIWSDRRVRAYLGVTAHFVYASNNLQPMLQSALLSCDRFLGSHTGEAISSKFQSVLEEYEISFKVGHIVTDNAANMRKAFSAKFLETEISADTLDAEVEEPDIWESLDEQDENEVIRVLDQVTPQERLSCFDHTLNLVVSDGLRETKVVSAALSKCCKMSSLLHQSSTFHEAYDNIFGANRGIPAIVSTRWNSVLRQIKAVTMLDNSLLSQLLTDQAHRNLILTAREFAQLQELVEVLDPFLEATLLTEGTKVVTISFVLPCVLQLCNLLAEFKTKLKYCTAVANALQASLQLRFAGLLEKAGLGNDSKSASTAVAREAGYSSDVYPISTFFHPMFRLRWIESELKNLSQPERNRIQKQVTDMVHNLVERCWSTAADADTTVTRNMPETSSPPQKRRKLLSNYSRHTADQPSSSIMEMNVYQEMEIPEEAAEDCFVFWYQNRTKLPRLYAAAMHALGIPAASAAVERVFSQGGLIMQPHRSRFSDRMLSSLIFLRCNNDTQ